MNISPRFLDELRARILLSDVIGKRISIARAGREYKACCPFHKEKTPSFTINDDKQFYHCFGCGAHGDIVGFVMEHDNLSFVDAVEVLAAQAGMKVPQQSPQQVQKAKEEKSLYTLLEEATRWFETQLQEPKNREALKYIRDRGLHEEALARHRVGYAPEDGQALVSYLKSRDYTDKQMVEAGLARISKKNSQTYSFFRERILFPVRDRRGRVVAYGGRILPDHLRPLDRSDFKPPKYINSSDGPLFHKGRMLYGESHARQAAGDGKPLIVTEGYLDVIACFEAGFHGAVAPLGTALTEEQITLLWKMIPDDVKEPVLCFDGDNAGYHAAIRASERLLPLLQAGHSARFAFLPKGEDPDTLIRAQGAGAFQNILDQAMPLVQFLWSSNVQGRSFNTPESRAALDKKLMQEVERIADRSVQAHYRKILRDKISKAFFASRFQAKQDYRKPGAALTSSLIKPRFQKRQILERVLVCAVLNHPDIYADIEEEFGSFDISEKKLDHLRESIVNALSLDQQLDRQGLQNHLYKEDFEGYLKNLLGEALYTHAGFLKTDKDYNEVLGGWRNAYSEIQKLGLSRDILLANDSLKNDINEENEEKFMRLLTAQDTE